MAGRITVAIKGRRVGVRTGTPVPRQNGTGRHRVSQRHTWFGRRQRRCKRRCLTARMFRDDLRGPVPRSTDRGISRPSKRRLRFYLPTSILFDGPGSLYCIRGNVRLRLGRRAKASLYRDLADHLETGVRTLAEVRLGRPAIRGAKSMVIDPGDPNSKVRVHSKPDSVPR